ncbi:hypothetical protein M707_23660 [Arthrobacter sp. AK-YN10]|nr:hypothetical protein M707_23660 [Arthrobacter sp. AK-YN10]
MSIHTSDPSYSQGYPQAYPRGLNDQTHPSAHMSAPHSVRCISASGWPQALRRGTRRQVPQFPQNTADFAFTDGAVRCDLILQPPANADIGPWEFVEPVPS